MHLLPKHILGLFIPLLFGLLLVSTTAVFATPDLPPRPTLTPTAHGQIITISAELP